MKKTTCIQNGHVIDPANKRDSVMDILVANGKIAQVGKKIDQKTDEVIDASGLTVTPGLVDMHVHLREPGREDKETIETGLKAALAGGITSVVTMPNTTPVTDSQSMVEFQIKRAKQLNLANLYPAGAITKGSNGKELAEIWEMKESGIVALTDDGHDVQDEGIMLKVMEYAKTHDLVILNHCEVSGLSGDGAMHEGDVSLRLGLAGIPSTAEEVSVMKILSLAEYTGARVHITHVSTKRSVELIEEYKKRGVAVTAETCPQYISLTDEMCEGYNTMAKMYPPLRTQEDVEALIKGLQNGIITVLATDHAPHTLFEKLQPFNLAARGTVGLETSFAVLYSYLVKTNKLSLYDVIKMMSVTPSEILVLEKGTLTEGADADISIFDLNDEWIVKTEELQTKGRNCVFEGMKLFGKARYVFVEGEEKISS